MNAETKLSIGASLLVFALMLAITGVRILFPEKHTTALTIDKSMRLEATGTCKNIVLGAHGLVFGREMHFRSDGKIFEGSIDQMRITELEKEIDQLKDRKK